VQPRAGPSTLSCRRTPRSTRSKFASCIAADGDPLVAPPETSELDYEVELAIVIGKEGRRITREAAMSYVAGFTVAHDVSARDWQLKKNGGQWLLGKAFDGAAPIGPAIVTPDEVGDVHNLRLRCIVNGVALQDGSTRELVHKTEDLLVWISKMITLKVGGWAGWGRRARRGETLNSRSHVHHPAPLRCSPATSS